MKRLGMNNMGENAKGYLEDKVKLQVSIIGIGNAGNQTIEKGLTEKYPVFAINSSVKDLSDVVVSGKVPSFISGTEARGAGKNRQKAKDLFKVNGKELFNVKVFTTMIESSDIVFVVASTAGGTGSGIAPELLYLLKNMYPDKIFIFYGILPKLSDSIMSQANTIQCLDEINKLEIPFALADLSHFEDIPNDVAYQTVGDHIIESINTIRGDYLLYSNSGMIDENDMRVIVGEPGYLGVYSLNKISPDQIDKRSIQSYMIDRVKNSPAVRIQGDQIVKQMGVISNFPDEMVESSKVGNYNELTSTIGTPISIFENYSVPKASFGQFIVILSGMNLPYTRISASKAIIDVHEEKLKKIRKIDLSDDVTSLSFLKNSTVDVLNNSKNNEEDKSNILTDFFK